jgi:hypothetical protein
MGAQTVAGTVGQPASAPRNPHTPQPSVGDTKTLSAGHDGHGIWAFLRRQPIRMVRGRPEGGYTDVYEIICPDCGDHPRVGYTEAGPRLQHVRGPYTLSEGLAAYERHIGAN